MKTRNRRNYLKFGLVILMLAVMGVFWSSQTCLAASAEIEITADSNDITIGESVMVYINIDSDTLIGDFEANLTYDENILEYQEGSSFIAGSSGFLKILNNNVMEGDFNRKYALEFKTLKVGTVDIAFMDRGVKVYDFDDDNEMPVSSNVLTISVKAAETASDNASLSALRISPSVLDPAFDKNILEYTTTLGYETTKLIVDAKPEDEKSIIKISGNDSLKEGENIIVITVIAETGTDIKYTIKAIREVAPPEGEDPEDTQIKPDTKLGTFEVVKMDGEIFAVYGGKYKLVEPSSEVAIPNEYIKSTLIISGISINTYYPKGNPAYDFLLIYAENEHGEAGFYEYDRVEKTLQRYTADSPFGYVEAAEVNPNITALKNEYRTNLMKAVIIITLLSVVCAVLIVISIRLYMKLQNKRDKRKRY